MEIGEREVDSYQSISFVLQLAWFASAFPRTADAPQLFLGVAERLAAALRPRAEVVVSQRGVDFSTVLFRGAEVALSGDCNELSVIPGQRSSQVHD